ncbi:MAG TPA: VWA domain-containing protein [Pyrinomonadaceae bacterium]|nr:VWA domain-containing protein [Pyrinomonadaceae bacterium]
MAENEGSKPTLTGIAAKLGRLPADKRRVALEISASLAGVSLRASRSFVESVPKAAKVLSAADIQSWGELGRRLSMGNVEAGTAFFENGAESFAHIPNEARGFVFSVCSRQLVLSSSTAVETYENAPRIAIAIGDPGLTIATFRLAAEIAGRSAKHSADFFKSAAEAAEALKTFGDRSEQVAEAAFDLGFLFASRTGGMTADLWAAIPSNLSGIDADAAITLLVHCGKMLDHGASVAIHFFSSGSEVLRREKAAFEDWFDVLERIKAQGNAVLIAFIKATPGFFSNLAGTGRESLSGEDGNRPELIRRVLRMMAEIAEQDAESALAAFRSSSRALRKVSIEQFEEWIETGLRQKYDGSAKARRSYFALETRESNAFLREGGSGLSLEGIQTVLRIYVEGLTGKEIEVNPLAAMPQESRIGNGTVINLPSVISEFDDDEMNFRLYKVLAAHGAGQIEFGTFEKDTVELASAFTDITARFESTPDQRDAFSLAGYIDEIEKGERVGLYETSDRTQFKTLPADSDYRTVLKIFPDPRLARKIFGTMENARIDKRLRGTYRGLRKDLDLMRSILRKNRPYIFDVPMMQVPFELLFQITLCGGATDDARQFYGQIVSEIEGVIERHLADPRATVADSIIATSRVYDLFQNIANESSAKAESETDEQADDDKKKVADSERSAEEAPTHEKVQGTAQDIKDLFNAWNNLDEEGEPDDLNGSEAWSQYDMPEQPLEPGEEAFAYDEWDRELNDYRVGWSRVVEKRVRHGDRGFVELARSRYRGVISSIRHQFQLMKPENLSKINRELDGEDYDLNALVDLVIDRKADGRQSENIYTKRLRRQRDVAVSILLDQSSSTARTITRNPLQPYTYPGRRIIEIEKEGLVLMSEALEAVGDVYSINGFTSEGRRNVKFYVVKDFDERYSEETERRIGGITFQNNTRLGAAIRHAANKLLRQENRTKLLIILTDGRPYDHDYGDARYAREDVREALIEAKMNGITPFCVTVDRESEAELKELYGDVGYTIIDDVLSLPERMPNIYRRLTS